MVARYSTEAKFCVVAPTTAEVIWVQNLLHELRQPYGFTQVSFCDTVGAIYLCVNLVFHSKMKHITIDFLLEIVYLFFVRVSCSQVRPTHRFINEASCLFSISISSKQNWCPWWQLNLAGGMKGNNILIISYIIFNDICRYYYLLSLLLQSITIRNSVNLFYKYHYSNQFNWG